ncbi:hypothetical protein DFP72DRAFT_846719 [Ephemerocybe angulata]|uniref:Uncharacterized protein n=1 Tax=Ephemerocybe angulata TaxID=980116 RepID=A0A8H6I009_9AGAR|nr:hypothetical protein DFP72DRAFT_846719 [Tulosesus angulatus]
MVVGHREAERRKRHDHRLTAGRHFMFPTLPSFNRVHEHWNFSRSSFMPIMSLCGSWWETQNRRSRVGPPTVSRNSGAKDAEGLPGGTSRRWGEVPARCRLKNSYIPNTRANRVTEGLHMTKNYNNPAETKLSPKYILPTTFKIDLQPQRWKKVEEWGRVTGYVCPDLVHDLHLIHIATAILTHLQRLLDINPAEPTLAHPIKMFRFTTLSLARPVSNFVLIFSYTNLGDPTSRTEFERRVAEILAELLVHLSIPDHRDISTIFKLSEQRSGLLKNTAPDDDGRSPLSDETLGMWLPFKFSKLGRLPFLRKGKGGV